MNILKSIIDAIFPKHYACLLCGRDVFDGSDFCTQCEEKIIYNDKTCCPVCGRRTNTDQICQECKIHTPLFDKGVSAFVYDSGVRSLILKFKNDGAYLKDFFAKHLYDKCASLSDAEAICFVPMTARAYHNRGYNQAQLLAEELGKLLSLPILKNAIAKVKNSSEQKWLTRAERLSNLHGCFKANREVVYNKTLIVVDDVLTTGATAEAICAELKKRGAKKIYFATAASVEYRELT